MRVESIMQCQSKGPSETYPDAQLVTLEPVADSAGEYQRYFEATPGGRCDLAVLNETALAEFEPGVLYRVTFEKIES